MLRSFALLCCVLIVRAAAAAPVDTGTDTSLVIDKFRQHFMVNRDGSFTYTHDTVTTIVEQRAIQANSQRSVSYNTSLEEIVALEAHTQKRDGRIVKVTSDQIKDQQESESADAPIFLDTRVKVVVFPDVEVGDKLVLHFVRKRHTPLFPGHFEDLSASEFVENKQFDLIYDMPDSMPLYADAVGFAPVPIGQPAWAQALPVALCRWTEPAHRGRLGQLFRLRQATRGVDICRLSPLRQGIRRPRQ